MKQKQRVLLIRSSYLPGRMGSYIVPPLGVLTLASVLRKERPKQVEFRILDTGVAKMPVPETARIMREYEPDVVGISSLSLEAAYLHRLADSAKKINPNTTVIAGGPHASCFYDEVLRDSNVDYAVVGEGEITFIELLDVIRDRPSTVDVKGVAFRRDGEIHYCGDRPYQEDLDSIPIPAWDLVDLKPYSDDVFSMNTFIARAPYAGLFTSRACPYNCIYCHSIFGKRFRAQSSERVLEEIEFLSSKMGVKELHIYDDVFNFDQNRVLEIAEGVSKRGIDMKFAFPNAVRGDLMTQDMVKALVKAGAYSITYAIETASPRLQKLIKKNLDLDKAFNAIEWTYDEGSIPFGFFMFGFPTETREEMEETIRFACRSKVLKSFFFSVIPFPRTEMYRLAKETYPDYDFTYDFSPEMYYWSKQPYYTEVSGIDMAKIFNRAWTKFYINPWRMWNILMRFPKNARFLLGVYEGFVKGFLGLGYHEEEFESYKLALNDSTETPKA